LSRCDGLTPCFTNKVGSNVECYLVAPASGYRLPSEAQWKYACRAVSQTQNAVGDDERLLPEYGYYSNNSTGRTRPAGDKLSNGWGLLDMHGNVWEWCWDWHGMTYYRESPDRHPSGPAGPNESSACVLRGGSWTYSAERLRSEYRSGVYHLADTEAITGFRVATALRKP